MKIANKPDRFQGDNSIGTKLCRAEGLWLDVNFSPLWMVLRISGRQIVYLSESVCNG